MSRGIVVGASRSVAAIPGLALAAGVSLGGCSEFLLRTQDPVVDEPPVQVEERFTQASLPMLDLLFVVDDTSSMEHEHGLLQHALAALPDQLDAAALSWQLGVVRTDLGNEDAGLLLGDPWVITPELPDPEGALADAADVGIEGLPPEAGLAATWLALSAPLRDGDNRGFRRPEAALHVVVLSDDDDDSSDYLDDDPGTLLLSLFEEEAALSGQPARLSAVVGPEPSGCSSADGGDAAAGSAYLALAEATGGAALSICEPDFAPLLDAVGDLSVAWPTRFELQAEAVADSVVVRIDDVRQDSGWLLEEDHSVVVFDEAPAAGSVIRVRYEVAE